MLKDKLMMAMSFRNGLGNASKLYGPEVKIQGPALSSTFLSSTCQATTRVAQVLFSVDPAEGAWRHKYECGNLNG